MPSSRRCSRGVASRATPHRNGAFATSRAKASDSTENTDMDRRSFIHGSSIVAGLAILAETKSARAKPGGNRSVVTPNGGTLPWKLAHGVKVGHLIAGPVDHEFAPGLRAECW